MSDSVAKSGGGKAGPLIGRAGRPTRRRQGGSRTRAHTSPMGATRQTAVLALTEINPTPPLFPKVNAIQLPLLSLPSLSLPPFFPPATFRGLHAKRTMPRNHPFLERTPFRFTFLPPMGPNKRRICESRLHGRQVPACAGDRQRRREAFWRHRTATTASGRTSPGCMRLSASLRNRSISDRFSS